MGSMSDSNGMRWTAGALGLLLAVAAGCIEGDAKGDDAPKPDDTMKPDGDGNGESGSGVSGTKTGAQLTAEDAVKLCEWEEKQAAGFESAELCTLFAQSYTESEAECEEVVTECVAEQGDGADFDCADSSKDDYGGESCTATVSELEACIRDEIAEAKVAAEDASCANAGKVAEPEPPAACKKLMTTCPDYFDEEEEEFTCDGGDTTYSADQECDDVEDCMDGDDEAGCEDAGEFTCDGGDTTYSASDKCDEFDDCADGADEAGCS